MLIMKTNICYTENTSSQKDKKRTHLRQIVSTTAAGFFVTGAVALNAEGIVQTLSVVAFCGCLLTILYMGSKSFAPEC